MWQHKHFTLYVRLCALTVPFSIHSLGHCTVPSSPPLMPNIKQFHVACSQLEPENQNYSSASACRLQSPGISTRALSFYYLSTWHVMSTNNVLGSTVKGRRPSSGLKCSQLFCNLIIVHDKPQTITLK